MSDLTPEQYDVMAKAAVESLNEIGANSVMDFDEVDLVEVTVTGAAFQPDDEHSVRLCFLMARTHSMAQVVVGGYVQVLATYDPQESCIACGETHTGERIVYVTYVGNHIANQMFAALMLGGSQMKAIMERASDALREMLGDDEPPA